MTPAENRRPWIAYRRRRPDAVLRLFCVPYAGAGASVFRDWSADMPESIEVCPVQLPGREDRVREPAFDRMAPLVDALVSAIGPYLDRRFALFGHSMGALIAFELARAIRTAGARQPDALILSGHRAPRLPLGTPLSHLPDDELIAAVHGLGAMRSGVLDDPGWAELLLPLIRSDCALCERYGYRPSAPLVQPLTVLVGREDSSVPVEDVEPWSLETTGSLTVRLIDGGHFFVHTARRDVMAAVADACASAG